MAQHPVPQTPAGTPDVVAHSEVDPTHGHGPELLGFNAEEWVYVGLLIFILLAIFVAKAPRRIAEILDARIAETRRQLDEARAIRAEAEALLNDAKARQAASTRDATAILQHAETEARDLVTKAEADAEQLVARRTRMAQDKIAAAERAAVDEVRARAAAAAAAAAEQLIRERLDGERDRALVDSAIGGLDRVF